MGVGLAIGDIARYGVRILRRVVLGGSFTGWCDRATWRSQIELALLISRSGSYNLGRYRLLGTWKWWVLTMEE